MDKQACIDDDNGAHIGSAEQRSRNGLNKLKGTDEWILHREPDEQIFSNFQINFIYLFL